MWKMIELLCWQPFQFPDVSTSPFSLMSFTDYSNVFPFHSTEILSEVFVKIIQV